MPEMVSSVAKLFKPSIDFAGTEKKKRKKQNVKCSVKRNWTKPDATPEFTLPHV
jgi:hypothetical protein